MTTPGNQEDGWIASESPAEALDRMSKETDALSAQLRDAEAARDHHAAEATAAKAELTLRERAWTRFTDRLNVIMDMIDLETDTHWTHAQRNGANMLWRGLLDMALQQWKTRQRSAGDDVPF